MESEQTYGELGERRKKDELQTKQINLTRILYPISLQKVVAPAIDQQREKMSDQFQWR